MEGSCLLKEQYQGISGAYRRREPEETVLYQVVQQNLETFLARMREACPDHDPVPDYVESTLRGYLECGILAHGFGRCWCPSCGHGFAVAYSCKTRGLCPSCNGKGGSSLNVHPHFHIVVADGVFSLNPSGQAVFYPATELCEAAWDRLQETLRRRIPRYFARHGYLDDDVVQDMLVLDHAGGFSLHGEVRIDEGDREGQ